MTHPLVLMEEQENHQNYPLEDSLMKKKPPQTKRMLIAHVLQNTKLVVHQIKIKSLKVRKLVDGRAVALLPTMIVLHLPLALTLRIAIQTMMIRIPLLQKMPGIMMNETSSK